jgi:hypothetical protein
MEEKKTKEAFDAVLNQNKYQHNYQRDYKMQDSYNSMKDVQDEIRSLKQALTHQSDFGYSSPLQKFGARSPLQNYGVPSQVFAPAATQASGYGCPLTPAPITY